MLNLLSALCLVNFFDFGLNFIEKLDLNLGSIGLKKFYDLLELFPLQMVLPVNACLETCSHLQLAENYQETGAA